MANFLEALPIGGIFRAAQRGWLTANAAVGAIMDPTRADLVAAVGETTGWYALTRIRDRMRASPSGRAILKDRPRITSTTVPLDKLLKLSPDTFGHAYATWMSYHGYSSDERPQVSLVDDEELAYVMQRYREMHDFWHTLSGLPPTVEGEVALKWFEMVQTGLPLAAIASFVGPFRLTAQQRQNLRTHYIPWASYAGAHAVYLMNERLEDRLEDALEDVRADLRFTPAPPVAGVSSAFDESQHVEPPKQA